MGLAIEKNYSYDDYFTIYSESSNEDLWNSLLRFSDQYILKSVHGLNDDSSIFVSMCMRQAYEYYLSGKAASLQTRPLYIYYCFLNLAKALICIKKGETEFKYHGLCETKFSPSYVDPSSILEYSTKVNAGVFQKFAEICGDTISPKTVFTFEKFTNNALEINHDVCEYYATKSLCTVPLLPVFPSTNPGNLILEIPLFVNDQVDIIKANSTILKDFDSGGLKKLDR